MVADFQGGKPFQARISQYGRVAGRERGFPNETCSPSVVFVFETSTDAASCQAGCTFSREGV